MHSAAMFEKQVAFHLQKYLGKYCYGLEKESLRLSVLKGDIVLRDLALKPEALDELRLPIKVRAGYVGSVTLKVPWGSLGKKPVEVQLDSIFAVAALADADAAGTGETDEDLETAARKKRLKAAEDAWVGAQGAATQSGDDSGGGGGWVKSYTDTVLGNLQLSITNVHVRFEHNQDGGARGGSRFAAGLLLRSLEAHTVDESGEKAFVARNALGTMRKRMTLEGLALYHDTDSLALQPPRGKAWDVLSADEWRQMFGVSPVHAEQEVQPAQHTYVLCPIDLGVQYVQLGGPEAAMRAHGEPMQSAMMHVQEIVLRIDATQYQGVMQAIEALSRATAAGASAFAHLRPLRRPRYCPGRWWRYAYEVVRRTAIRKHSTIRWSSVKRLCACRREYIHAYASVLMGEGSESEDAARTVDRLDTELEYEAALLFRCLAHTEAKRRTRSKQLAAQKKVGSSWYSWWTGSSSKKDAADAEAAAADAADGEDGSMGEEEWATLQQLVEDSKWKPPAASSEAAEAVQMAVKVHIAKLGFDLVQNGTGKAMATLIDGRMLNVGVDATVSNASTAVQVSVARYFLGDLLRSGQSNTAIDVLVEMPPPHGDAAASVDMRCRADLTSPLFRVQSSEVTELVEFFKLPSADIDLSTTVTVAAGVANQAAIEAQTRMRSALASRTKLALSLNIGAPQILVPSIEMQEGAVDERSMLLVDFGRLEVRTDPSNDENYDHFGITLRGACLHLLSHNEPLDDAYIDDLGGTHSSTPILEPVTVHVGIDVQHSGSTAVAAARVGIVLDDIRLHVSPARLRQLVYVRQTVSASDGDGRSTVHTAVTKPWREFNTFDISGRVAVRSYDRWKQTTTWIPAWAAISGPYLVLCEDEDSVRPKQWIFLGGGRVVSEAGSNLCRRDGAATIVLHSETMSVKEALDAFQDTNVCALELDSSAASTWAAALRLATTANRGLGLAQVAAATTVSVPGSSAERKPALYVAGIVPSIEVKLSGNTRFDGAPVPVAAERPIARLSLSGGRVAMEQYSTCMDVRAAFSSLDARDELSDAMGLPILASSSQGVDCLPGSVKEALDKVEGDMRVFQDACDDVASDDVVASDIATARTDRVAAAPACSYSELLDTIGHAGHFERQTDLLSASISMVSSGSWRHSAATPETDVTLTLRPFRLFCRVPTVKTLLALSEQLADPATASGEAKDAGTGPLAEDWVEPVDDRSLETPAEQPTQEKKSTGAARQNAATFKLRAKLQNVTLTLLDDDASMVAALALSRVAVETTSCPDGGMVVDGRLGGIKVVDGYCASDEMYWEAIRMHNPSDEMLVQLRYEVVPSANAHQFGYASAADVKAASLRIVYLARFIARITEYSSRLATATPASVDVDQSTPNVRVQGAAHASGGGRGREENVLPLKLSINIDAPVLDIPRSSESSACVRMDLGRLRVSNALENACDVVTVALEEASIELRGPGIGSVNVTDAPLAAQVELTKPLFASDGRSATAAKVSLGDVGLLVTEKSVPFVLLVLEENLGKTATTTPALVTDGQAEGASDQADAGKSESQDMSSGSESTGDVCLSVSATLDTIKVRLGQANGNDVVAIAELLSTDLKASYVVTADVCARASITVGGLAITDAQTDTDRRALSLLGWDYSVSPPAQQTFLHLTYDDRGKTRGATASIRVTEPTLRLRVEWAFSLLHFVNSASDGNRPKIGSDDLVLKPGPYVAPSDTVLSERCRLLADATGDGMRYIFDGNGNALEIPIMLTHQGALIVVGHGHELHFTNTRIVNSENLSSCTYLSSGARVTFGDSVTFDGCGGEPFEAEGALATEAAPASAQPFTTTIDIVGANVTLLSKNDRNDAVDGVALNVPAMSLLFSQRGASVSAEASVSGARMEHVLYTHGEASNPPVRAQMRKLMDPFDFRCTYPPAGQEDALAVTSLRASVDADTLDVLSRLTRAVSTFVVGQSPLVKACTEYSRVLPEAMLQGTALGSQLSFWQVRAPLGYASLGHVAMCGNDPPTNPTLVVDSARTAVASHGMCALARPTGFEPMWVDPDKNFTIWRPVPASGYVAMGCVVGAGVEHPSLDIVQCMHESLIRQSSCYECVSATGVSANELVRVWQISGPLRTFTIRNDSDVSRVCTMRDPSLLYSMRNARTRLPRTLVSPTGSDASTNSRFGRYAHCFAMQAVFVQKKDNGRGGFTIWKVQPPAGYVALGDWIADGDDYPTAPSVVLRDHPDCVAPSGRWTRVWNYDRAKGYKHGLALWAPVPPSDDYVALGCVWSQRMPTAVTAVRCVHRNLVETCGVSDRSSAYQFAFKYTELRVLRTVKSNSYFAVLPSASPSAKLWQLVDFKSSSRTSEDVIFMTCPGIAVTAYDMRPGLKNQPLLQLAASSISAGIVQTKQTVAVRGTRDMQTIESACSLTLACFNPQLGAWEPLVEPFQVQLSFHCEAESEAHELPAKTLILVRGTSALELNASSAMLYRLIDSSRAFLAASEGGNTLAVRNSLSIPVWLRAVHSSSRGDDYHVVASGERTILPMPVESTEDLGARAHLEAPEYISVQIVALRQVPHRKGRLQCQVRARVDRTGHSKAVTRWNQADNGGSSDAPAFSEVAFDECFLLHADTAASTCPMLHFEAGCALSGDPTNAEVLRASATIDVSGLPLARALETVDRTSLILAHSEGELHLDVRIARSDGYAKRASLSLEKATSAAEAGAAPCKLLFSVRDPHGDASVAEDGAGWHDMPVHVAMPMVHDILESGASAAGIPRTSHTVITSVTIQGGRRQVDIRAPVVVQNKTGHELALGISNSAEGIAGSSTDLPGSPSPRAGAFNVTEHEVFENQRFLPFKGFKGTHLFPTERKSWQYTVHGKGTSSSSDPREGGVRKHPDGRAAQPWLEDGAEWVSAWEVDLLGLAQNAVDKDGWAYAFDFSGASMGMWKPHAGQGKNGTGCFVRRRRWLRRARSPGSALGSSASAGAGASGSTALSLRGSDYRYAGSIGQGGLSALPHSAVSALLGTELVFAVTEGDERISGWSEIAHSQSGGGVVPSLLRPQRWLMRCASGADYTYLCAEASQTKIGVSADSDWTLTITAPLSVTNALPFPVAVELWEKPKYEKQPTKQMALSDLKPGDTCNAYRVDLARPSYLSLRHGTAGGGIGRVPLFVVHDYVQARAKRHMDEAALVLGDEPYELRLPSGRTVAITVERKCADNFDAAASVSVRFHAPFWLNKHMRMPLAYSILRQRGSVGDDGAFNPAEASHATLVEEIGCGGLTNIAAVPASVGDADTLLLRVGVLTGEETVWSGSVPIYDGGTGAPAFGTYAIDLVEAGGRKTFPAAVAIEEGEGAYASTAMVNVRPRDTITNRAGLDLWLFEDTVEDGRGTLLQAGAVDRGLSWSVDDMAERVVRIAVDAGGVPNTRVVVRGTSEIRVYGAIQEDVHLCCICQPGSLGSYHLELNLVALHELPYRIENRSEYELALLETSQRPVALSPFAAMGWVWTSSDQLDQAMRIGVTGSNAVSDELRLDDDPRLFECSAFGDADQRLRAWLQDDGHKRVLVVAPSKLSMVQHATTPAFDESSASGNMGALRSANAAGVGVPGVCETRMLLPEIGLSVIDSTPEELAYVCLHGASVGITRCRTVTQALVKVQSAQVDNCLVGTPFPVMLVPGTSQEPDISFTLVTSNNLPGVTEVPFCKVALSSGTHHVYVHERLVWRLMDFVAEIGLERLAVPDGDAPRAFDNLVRLDRLRIERGKAKVTIKVSPENRPGWLSNDAVSAGLSLVDGVALPLNLRPITLDRFYDRQSKLTARLVKAVTDQMIRQAMRVLTKNVGVLLSNVATSVQFVNNKLAGLSMDKEYIRERAKARSAVQIGDLADGLVEGSDALAHGLLRGVTGVFLKPVEGAKKDGIKGFVKGVGKGVIGLATQPVTGVIDFATQTAEGAIRTIDKVTDKVKEVGEEALTGSSSADGAGHGRARVPRALLDGRIEDYEESLAMAYHSRREHDHAQQLLMRKASRNLF